MPRAVAVPRSHGPVTTKPGQALQALGFEGGRIVRPLGGNANMHWLVEVGGDRLVLRRYGPWRELDSVLWETNLIDRVGRAGWRVPRALTPPQLLGGHLCAPRSSSPAAVAPP